MAIIYWILGIILCVIALVFNAKKEPFSKGFKRNQFAILHLLKYVIYSLLILGLLNLGLGIATFWIALPKWVALCDVFIILVLSMILSFKLAKQMS